MAGHDIICIGASAGGIEPLMTLASSFPPEFPASVFIVVHMPSTFESNLPQLLTGRGGLEAMHAVGGETVRPGRIYVARPGFHLLIRDNRIEVSVGPKEMGFRPAINPLFRTAAAAYGKRVVGIILSGLLEDGVSGLMEIKRHGGVSIVQDPKEALFPDMPRSAIYDTVEIDYILKAKDMATQLGKLTARIPENSRRPSTAKKKEFPDDRKLTPLVCPLCGGSIFEKKTLGHREYACHVGHTFSADYMGKSYAELLENNLWSSLRILQEMEMFYKDYAGQDKKGVYPMSLYRDKADRIHRLSEEFNKVLLQIQKESEDMVVKGPGGKEPAGPSRS